MARNEVWGVLPGFGPPYIGVKGGQAEDPAVLSVVEPNGPASAADLKVGDVVTSFDGKKITTFQDLMNAVKATSPGDVVQIIVRRGNQGLQMPIQIGTRKQ
jgi:S1-C subfamily serine protease